MMDSPCLRALANPHLGLRRVWAPENHSPKVGQRWVNPRDLIYLGAGTSRGFWDVACHAPPSMRVHCPMGSGRLSRVHQGPRPGTVVFVVQGQIWVVCQACQVFFVGRRGWHAGNGQCRACQAACCMVWRMQHWQHVFASHRMQGAPYMQHNSSQDMAGSQRWMLTNGGWGFNRRLLRPTDGEWM